MSGKELKDDLDDLVNSIENVSVDQEKKKKKKNKKKKEGGEEKAAVEEKIPAENGAPENGPEGEDSASSKKKKPKKKKGVASVQTEPPTVPVKELFPSGQFPEGQIMEHPIALSDTTAKNRWRRQFAIIQNYLCMFRFNSEEARAIDRLQIDMYNEIRQAMFTF